MDNGFTVLLTSEVASAATNVEVCDVVVDESPGEVDCCHQRSWDGDAAVSEQFTRNKLKPLTLETTVVGYIKHFKDNTVRKHAHE